MTRVRIGVGAYLKCATDSTLAETSTPPRSVLRKTYPVSGGAGSSRTWTGTAVCKPMPFASTGRARVVCFALSDFECFISKTWTESDDTARHMPLVIARKAAQRRISLWQTRYDSDRSSRHRCHVHVGLPY